MFELKYSCPFEWYQCVLTHRLRLFRFSAALVSLVDVFLKGDYVQEGHVTNITKSSRLLTPQHDFERGLSRFSLGFRQKLLLPGQENGTKADYSRDCE